MTERELIYEIYGLIEENRGGQKSRPHLYWLIGSSMNRYAAEHPMQKDITGVLADRLEESIKTGVGFSGRNLRYMRKFAQTMPHPDQWDDAARERRWTDYVKSMVQTEGAGKGGRQAPEPTAAVRTQPRTVTPKRHAPSAPILAEPDRARLTDTHIVALTSAVLSRIPGVSLIGLDRHLGKWNLLEAVSLHVVSPDSEADVVLVVHGDNFKAVEIERIHRGVIRKFPWRTITFAQFNVDTRKHSTPDSNDLKLLHLIKRLMIEVRRVFLAPRS
ncbi:DUF1016 N-terminal domain-containing protein [Deinococcus sp. PEB2-63]